MFTFALLATLFCQAPRETVPDPLGTQKDLIAQEARALREGERYWASNPPGGSTSTHWTGHKAPRTNKRERWRAWYVHHYGSPNPTMVFPPAPAYRAQAQAWGYPPTPSPRYSAVAGAPLQVPSSGRSQLFRQW